MERDKKVSADLSQRLMLVGKVVSDKMHKTVVVETERVYKHAEFNKIVRKMKTYKVHDEGEEASVGDLIEFYEGRPVSKTKYMYLARVVKANTAV